MKHTTKDKATDQQIEAVVKYLPALKRHGFVLSERKVRLSGFRCSVGHPMTAREGKGGVFMGCENRPDCDSPSEPLENIEGM